MMKLIVSLTILILLVLNNQKLVNSFNFYDNNNISNGQNDSNEKCFCKLNEEIDDCDCKIESIEKINNYKIHPRINALVQKDYFKYIKVNLNKICQFWPDDARCSLKDCHVKTCNEDELPLHFKEYFKKVPEQKNKNIDHISSSSSSSISSSISNNNNNNENKKPDKEKDCEQTNPLGHLNSSTLTDQNLKTFEDWNKYDDAQDNFCEPDDESESKAEYTDLVSNPERYTGYKAAHANKIWSSIYRENCFENTDRVAYGPEKNACLEKRFFYRLVSGLHTSINVHLSAKYLHRGLLNQPDHWGPNLEEFKKRFDPETTNGMGPKYLKNLYFIYLTELRAIAKAAPYLEKETFYTGNPEDDQETKKAVVDLLEIAKSFKHHFNETKLFRGDPVEAKKLKKEFQIKFRNITKIMDCVGCDKCRLWGKVQTLALGTALKILFSGKIISPSDQNNKNVFQLSRSEIVALFNGFARLSNSVAEVEHFRDMMTKQNTRADPINHSNRDL